VRWYSINDGPTGIRELVNATSQSLLVDIWTDLSRSVHGSRVMETVERRPAELMHALVSGGFMLSPLRSSALTCWWQLLVHADLLWTLATLAVLMWEEQEMRRLFAFNQATRMPRLAAFEVDLPEKDLICTLERTIREKDAQRESAG
jgi:hypothetical protein